MEFSAPQDGSLRVMASLYREGVTLDLKPVDLCFLVALHAQANQRGLPCMEEDLLLDVFEQVCDAVTSDGDNVRKRATHAIQRLRDQRLLARVDGSGFVRAGEYSMTRLATAIVSFFLADQILTRESLTLLTKTLLMNLGQIRTAARKAQSPEDWQQHVVGPLRVVVTELVGGIESRQRGLDTQQEQVQKDIMALLGKDWFAAMDQCQQLLESTTATLQELNTILLRDAHQILTVLTDIAQSADQSGLPEAQEATQRVTEQVERVAAWGRSRQLAWSNFYQYVHRFLRDVVRLDPSRALSERLRNQLSTWTRQPFAWQVAHAPRIRILRETTSRQQRPPVTQPSQDRESRLEEVVCDGEATLLEGLVGAALAEGAATLSGVLARILPRTEAPQRYVVIGRVVALVAAACAPRSERERPWVPVPGALEVEEWALLGGTPYA